jgi:hypothetical protein
MLFSDDWDIYLASLFKLASGLATAQEFSMDKALG